MKWASLPLLALVLFLSLCDLAVSQTPSSLGQNRQRVNENVLFLMGGSPAPTYLSIAAAAPSSAERNSDRDNTRG
jgi:hypothetical protein